MTGYPTLMVAQDATADELWNEWMRWLRSQAFTQGDGMLTERPTTDGDALGVEKDCCLGVVCKLGIQLGLVFRTTNHVISEHGFVYHSVKADGQSNARDYSSGGLPRKLAKRMGVNTGVEFNHPVLPEDYPRVKYGQSPANGAIALNDSWSATFAEIADILEDQKAKGNLRPYQPLDDDIEEAGMQA